MKKNTQNNNCSYRRLFIYLFLVSLILPNTVFSSLQSNRSQIATTPVTPLLFEQNLGQFRDTVDFAAKGGGYSINLGAQPIIELYRFRANPEFGGNDLDGKAQAVPEIENFAEIRLDIVGARKGVSPTPLDKQQTLKHYLVGSPSDWHIDVPNFSRVRYSEILPGIDVEYYGVDGRLEYDFVVKPGADPKAIGVSYKGTKNISINAEGDLVLNLGYQQIVQRAPYTYQKGTNGETIEVVSSYTLNDGVVGFEVAPFDREQALIIDPILEYSRYYGGTSLDRPYAIDLDASGNIYVIADSTSVGLATPGAYDEGDGGARQEVAFYPLCTDCTDPGPGGQVERINIVSGVNDRGVLVTKFSPSGLSIMWSAFMSGTSLGLNSAAVSDAGEVAFGITSAPAGLPLVNETQVHEASQENAYVAKLNSSGSGFVFATYLNLGDGLWLRGLDVSASGQVAVSGGLGAGNTFPVVTGIPGQSCTINEAASEIWEGYVALFGSTGTLSFSSCLGGDLEDGTPVEALRGVTIDNGDLYVIGYSSMTDFPVVNPIQATKNVAGAREMTISQINPDTGALVFSTWFGPTAVGNPPNGYDYDTHIPVSQLFPWDIKVDSAGNIVVTGSTGGLHYPVLNAIQTNLAVPRVPTEFLAPGTYKHITPPIDFYVTKLHPDNGVVFSTYLGGSGPESSIPALALDGNDNIYLLGLSPSEDYPVLNAIQPTLPEKNSLVLSKITPEGALAFSTYLGGSNGRQGNLAGGVTVNAAGQIILAGFSSADDFPIVGSGTSHSGNGDIVLAIIDQSGDTDMDGDGVPDVVDDFPANGSEWKDTDEDLTGDNTDTDDDDDGEPDVSDRFPLDGSETVDNDEDGAGDNRDDFDDDLANYFDFDEDGIADFDAAELNIDGDAVDNADDQFDFDASETTDSDQDGIGDNSDTDDDGDLTPDTLDLEPLDFDIPVSTFERYSAWDANLFKSPWPAGFEAVDETDAAWTSAEDQSFSGSRSFTSRIIGHGQVAAIKRTDTFPTGDIEFRYKVDSQNGADLFTFSIDDVIQLTSSGDTGWQLFSIPITAGAHTIEWRYTKDGSISEGDDAAWIDDFFVRVEGGPTEHFVTTWKTDNPGTSNSTSITVPMVGGPYDVDWDNDGAFDELELTDSTTHDYGVAGTYTIRVRGVYTSFNFGPLIPLVSDAQKLLSLDQWGTNSWISMTFAFYNATNLQILATDIPDFSAVTRMDFMFKGATSANPDTSNWDTSAVTDMKLMFADAISANPNTSGWSTAAVTDMTAMFANAPLANPDTSDWDTAAVTRMHAMFLDATSSNPDTSGWNTSAVTDMSKMFAYTVYANPDTSGWDTSAVTDMRNMFQAATSANPAISGWDTSSVTDMHSMFQGATSANPDISGWNTSAVTDMSQLFSGAMSFDQDIGGWDVTALIDATNMFDGMTLSTSNYESLLLGWDAQELQPGVTFSGGSSTYCSAPAIAAKANMVASDSWAITDGGQICPPNEFSDDFVTTWKTDNPGTSNSTSITVPMVGGPFDVDWNNDKVFDEFGVSGAVTHDYGIAGIKTIRIRGSYDSIQFANGGDKEKIISLDQWGTNTWTSMYEAFFGTVNLIVPAVDFPDFSNMSSMYRMFYGATLANPDTSGWDTSSITNMALIFTEATSADPDTSGWDTSSVTDMGYMFLSATSANPDTSGWDTSAVTTMYRMFYQATSANPDTNGWNTSNVTDMRNMFAGATSANPDTSSWDTSSVTNMSFMFYQATSANPNTSSWDTSSVTSMASMFRGAASANPNTSNWNTASVANMGSMFRGATSANPDTSGWNTAAVTEMGLMFLDAGSANPDTSGWDTSLVTNMSGMFSGATSASPNTSAWDTSAVTNMNYMFYNATSSNPDTSGWDTPSVTKMSGMFSGATSFNRDVGSWNVTSVTEAIDMFNGVTLSTANYESLLIGWNAQTLQPGVTFSGGNSTYCSEVASAARASMIASDSWVITDGGSYCPPADTCNVNMVSGTTEYFDASYEACEILVLGPDFIAADGSNVSASSGWEIDFLPGFSVEKGATLEANVCGQSLCMTSSNPMPYGCHSCVNQICDIDPSCCALEFDQACLDRVSTTCGLVCE